VFVLFILIISFKIYERTDMSVKYCYNRQDGDGFEEIVNQSYDATKRDVCMRLGFVPIEVALQDDTGTYVRVPGAKYQWLIGRDALNALEVIGDASMNLIGVELWRIKRSMEMLKKQSNGVMPVAPTPAPVAKVPVTVTPSTPSVVKVTQQKEVKKEKVQITYVWPEQKATGIRVIKTWADGSQLLDDGKERWMNEMWSQPVKYVCR
jgi:hypothetical protein